MRNNDIYAFLGLIVLINLTIDLSFKNRQKCVFNTSDTSRAQRALSLLIFHHVLSVFLLFGWMVPDRRLLLLFIIGNVMMLMEWAIYGHCRLTRMLNQICDDPKELAFRDLFWWLGIKDMYVFGSFSVFTSLAVIFLLIGICRYTRFI